MKLGEALRAPLSIDRASIRAQSWLIACVVVLGVLVLPGSANAEFENSGAFGTGIFSAELGGIAVNRNTGDLYVADRGNRRVERFDAEGNFVEAWGWGVATGASEYQRCTTGCLPGLSGSGEGEFKAPVGVAVDQESEAVYVMDVERTTGVVQKFSAEGTYLSSFGERGSSDEGQIQQPDDEYNKNGIAVGPDGSVYVNDKGEAFGPRVMVFNSSGAYQRSLGQGTPEFGYDHSVAVDDDGDVFVSDEFLVYKFEPSGALAWTHEEGSYALQGMTVDPESGEVFYYAVDEYPEGDFVRLDPEGNVVEKSPGQAGEEGTYGVAFNPAYEPAGRPAGALYAVDSGLGKGSIYGQPPVVAPTIDAESVAKVGQGSAMLRAQIDPNKGKTTYVFQYGTAGPCSANPCAEAPAGGAVLGAGSEVLTAATTLSGLTPGTTYHYRVLATNGGGTVEGEDRSFTTFPSTPVGLPDGRAYEMVSPPVKDGGQVFPPSSGEGNCTECAPGVASAPLPMQVTDDGGEILYEGEPFSPAAGAGENEYIAARSPDGWQTTGITSPLFGVRGDNEFELFSPDLGRGILHIGGLHAPAPAPEGVDNEYLWRTGGGLQPLVASAPPHRTPGGFRVRFAGANSGTSAIPALTHLLLAANDALTGAVLGIAPAAPDPGNLHSDLYEWSGGSLHLVNVLPGNNAVAGGEVYFGAGGNGAPNETVVDRAVSDDGSHVFWSDESGQLYVRIDNAETQQIEDPGGFLTASADGSKVLLDDGCLYDLATGECEADLSQGHGATFEGILGTTESLSRIYFVDTEVLTGAEENANGERAEATGDNLYLWQGGTTSFIGRLLPDDNELGNGHDRGDWRPREGARTAQISPDGRFLAFVSRAPLTGYDNFGPTCKRGGTSRLEPAACEEIFRFDAASGRLSCASCNPTGALPLGPSKLGSFGGQPPFSLIHNLTDEGAVAFESQDVLSPQDINGRVQDVYEWVPDGIESCQRASGCVALISSGHSSSDSYFFGVTPSGNDALFITRDQLVPQDQDQLLDLYDARVGGGFAATPESVPCAGESCKGPLPALQPGGSPGSASFAGSGNPPRHGNCSSFGHRAKVLSNRAQRLRRRAGHLHDHRRANRLRGKAHHFARRGHHISAQAKRCRRASQGAGK